MGPTGTSRRQRVPREVRKAQMLDVAEQVFAERGFAAASMDDIAERVGLSKPMLYEYFGSKEGLLVGCINRARTELRQVTEHAVAEADGAEDALRRAVRAFFDYIEHRRVSWCMLRHESAVTVPWAVDEIEGIRRQQTELFAMLTAGYLPGAGPMDLEAAAEVVVGACERVALWAERRGDVSAATATEYVMRFVWSGLVSVAAR
ncbi:TetR family transcriptional regulator [Gandjariella thermophila]|uniref:TetR family transcriptional regulator n=1 Tax=Gandjariella thermophila TaxID=1931992 RepID=A0A4D4JHT1_9PSEU|nr:TetR family transcriptional regulator [Gandjariella thermophila]